MGDFTMFPCSFRYSHNNPSLKEDPPDRSTEELNKLKLELNRKLRTLDRRENRLGILLGEPEKPVDEEA